MICRCLLAMDLGPRRNQEDCLLAGEQVVQTTAALYHRDFVSPCPVVSVCDGMGGHAAGETASRFVCEQLKACASLTGPPSGGMRSWLREVQSGAQQVLPAESGTTVAGVLACGGRGHFFNLGDSRIYRLRPGGIERVSHDHSPVQEMLDHRLISEDEAFTHPHRNLISFGIGPAFSIGWDPRVVNLTVDALSPEHHYLFCSDGVTDVMRDEELFAVLGPRPLENGAALMNALRSRGLKDNTSYLVAQFIP